jgi:protein-L-isoaspartate(D-aspartate) O-methyltransferase
MDPLIAQRRFYAEEIQVASNLSSPAVVEALATVPRERFLPPGPWTIRGEADFQGPPRQTPDRDPRHVYHNIAVAIDPGRMLFNGAPTVVAMAIDRLKLQPGHRVLHIGAGLGYYTALIACAVGPDGRALGIEVDPDLAARAAANLSIYPNAEVRAGNGTGLDETFDAILVNAGVTHPLPAWLDSLAPGGRLVLPLTATLAAGPIGKGPLILMSKTDDLDRMAAQVIGFVAIYSAVGIRDDAINALVGEAMKRSPFPPLRWLRRDAHEATDTCWVHAPGFCLSLA